MICVYFVNVMERAIINKLRRHRPDKLVIGHWWILDPIQSPVSVRLAQLMVDKMQSNVCSIKIRST